MSGNRGHTFPKGGSEPTVSRGRAPGMGENGERGGTKSPGRVDFPEGFSPHYSHLDPLFCRAGSNRSRR